MTRERKKIILVEDNKAEADLTKIIYKEQKIECEIHHFNDGEELIKNLPEIPLDRVCYILLDLNMPRMNGHQVLKHLLNHAQWKKLPVIVFSSSTFERDVNTSYELGAKAYVTKPMDINNLSKVIGAIDGFWGGVNTPPAI